MTFQKRYNIRSIRTCAAALGMAVAAWTPFENELHADKLQVVTTTSDLAYIAGQIAQDRAQVTSLIRGGDDPHFMEARPDFVVKMHKADAFVEIGLDLEIGWAPVLLAQARNPKIQKGSDGYCDASRGIHILELPTGPVDRSRGDIHIYGNPHYWTDPLNAAIMARNVRDLMKRIDPGSAAAYDANYTRFFDRLKDLTLKQSARMRPFSGLKVAVYHKELSYFAERFKLRVVAPIEEKPGVPPSAAYLKEVIEKLKHENVRLILITPFNNPKYAQAVARDIGGAVVVMPVSVNSATGITTYENTIEAMVERVVKAAGNPGR